MAYAFERFVFYQTTVAERERVAALQILYPQLTRDRVLFIDSDLELETLEPNDFLVCANDSLHYAYPRAFAMGYVGLLTFADFIKTPAHFIDLQASTIFGEVVLAFLSEPLKKQAVRLFSLFGFNPIAVDSLPILLKELKHRASLVVFDQDMPTQPKQRGAENRTKIFSLLRAERKQRRQLSVIIIKDFDQGSLFSDMTTQAKDVSNAMLSPQEFLEFIRNYLCDFHTAHATWKLKTGTNTGLAKANYTGRPTAHLGLNNIKEAFEIFQDRSYQEFILLREQLLAETLDLSVKMRATDWLFDKQLAQAADSAQKNLLIRAQLPRALEKSSLQIQVNEGKPSEEPSTGDVMFN
ncbi:MAG TPA: hypothetical protein PLY93_09185 [Turneriella sp.]|nr:hypothetical protein [Turneriella sp.]